MRTVFLLTITMLALTGCGNTLSIEVDGRDRSYVLHVPAGYSHDLSVPLVLALHGFTGTGKGLERISGLSLIADREGFIVAYPDGIRRSWNAGRDADGPDDVKFLEALIDEISGKYSLDPGAIFVTGASNGNMMAQYLACNSSRIAAFAGVMGTLPRSVAENCVPSQPVAALFIHGTADPIIPFEGGETSSGPGMTTDFLSAEENLAFWAEANGCSGDPTETILPESDGDPATLVAEIRYTCPEGTSAILYRVEGGGHTWPGHKDPYPEFIVGPLSMEIDASEVIWSFFESQRDLALAGNP